MASKTLQSTIEISGVLSPSLQSAIKNAVGKLEEMSKETLESAGAAEKLSAEIGAQESVLKSLQKGYADYIVSGKESSDEAQTLADKIQELSGELDENRGTLQAAEKAAKRLAETQDDSADAYTRLERKINSQQDELEDLRRKYANVVLEQGKTSKEAKQLEGKISSLSGELKKNEKKLKEVGEAAEEAGQKAEKSGEGYTVLKNVIANLASEAISKAVEAFKELATEGDTALGMLEARTGATGEKMEGFEAVMDEVYKANYGDSLGDVSEKLSTVIQMTDDLDNASLAKVTKSAIALEDVFGFDVRESMRAVNSLMDQFGITSDQAFNLLVQGAQNGLNQNDDLLDTINEYSVQFKDAGYTADDMFNMLANGAASGTWSVDKLGDSVKEFNIRMSDGTANEYLEELGVDVDTVMAQFNKGGPEAQKAIGTVMDAILKCDDATLQYQAGVGLFGTMWEDLGADTVASLMNTQGAISSTNDAMAQMDSSAYDTLEAKLGRLIREYKTVGSTVAGAAGTVTFAAANWDTITAKAATAKATFSSAGSAIAGLSGATVAAVAAVVAAVAILIGAIINLWKNNENFRNNIIGIWEEIKGKFESFGQGITDRLNALGFDFENFGEVLKAAWDAYCAILGARLQGLFQQLSNILSLALDLLTGLFDFFVGLFTGDWEQCWQGVKEIFGGVWDFLVATFENYLNVFTKTADIVLGWFGSSWEEAWGQIKDFFVNIWNGITSFLSGVWEAIKGTVISGVQFIGNLISFAFQIITLPFRFIWENCKEYVFAAWEWIKEKVSAAINAVKSVVSSVWNTVKSLTSTVWNAISGVISSVWSRIKSAVSAAINTVKSVVSNVWNGIKSVTSSVWNSIKSTVSGVWNGIKAGVSNAVNSVKSTVSNVWNGIKSVTSSVWNSIKSAITTPINKAWSVVSGVISKLKNAFNFSWSLPKLKLPHISVKGGEAPYGIAGKGSLPKFSIEWYKDGAIMTSPTVFGINPTTGNLMAGGEAGAEAVLPLAVLWDKLELILRRILSGENTTEGTSGEGLTSKAGELLTLDNFSLGSLADGTNVVIYYDFSHFTWSPQFQTGGTGDDEDDLMARLKAHEAEFFDWLEEFIQMREVAQYA